MKSFLTIALPVVIAVGILLMWIASLWSGMVFQIIGFLLLAPGALLWGMGRLELRWNRQMLPLAAMAAWPFLQLLFGSSLYAWRTQVAGLYWTAALVYYFLAYQAFADPALLGRFLRWLLFPAYVFAMIGPLQNFTSPDRIFWLFPLDFTGNAMGPFLYVSQFAAYAELILPIALYAAVTDEQFRAWHSAGAALLYTAVVVSSTRAGLVFGTAAVVVCVIAMVARPVIRLRRLGRLLRRAAALAVILVAASGPAALIRKFSDANPYAERRTYLRASISMIRDHPVTGVGMGNWVTAYPGYMRVDAGRLIEQARNDWAQWTAEGGIPFLIFMLWFAGGTLKSAYRTIWGYGLAAVFLHCWLDFLLDRTAMAILFFTLSGAAAATKGPPVWTARPLAGSSVPLS